MKKIYLSVMVAGLLAGCASNGEAPKATAGQPTKNTIALMAKLDPTKAPAQNFDLSKWKLNIPMEDDKPERAGKVMEIYVHDLSNQEKPFSNPDWFYTDKETGAMVFKTPNKAMTTPNSKNARSELRAMLATDYGDPKNNFTIASNPDAASYGAVGGELSATLSVDWVSTSGNDKKNGAFSTVIGQIHGSTNEPLKIVYRKLPGQEYGSLYWRYEINATGENRSKRKDIYHNVFGAYNLRTGSPEPTDGIKLGEVFSYDINVKNSVMNLTFVKNVGEANEVVKTFSVDLSKGKYQGNEYDEGYATDWMYFKAGNYNQCNVGSSECTNKGIAAGDYAQVSFYQLDLKQ
ncbi:polysaccharide lyase family 7 protein [Psychromonas sp. RZ22]|uniref:polysaccharide lyase family 7 protein n=1 Tax=Psychromonas algarum TaxID=2555643 RepID=UPI0010676BB7|nr:polysaccharide lyase family 7 protein [Psychromonas sp. RZ22]TEW53524.1 polysaccharide lyase family 7 protein [Psychromonas sp. RZ22]